VTFGAQLAAILCATFTATARSMGEDEEATLHTSHVPSKLIDSAIDQHHGRSSTRRQRTAEFASVVEAVICAVAIQTGLNLRTRALHPIIEWSSHRA